MDCQSPIKNLNEHMHPRNIYKGNPPDFLQLSETYANFKPFINHGKHGKVFVNFRNPAAVRTLAQCLLHRDFGIDVVLPTDRLAPTIPSRLNYILWVEDLVNSVKANSNCTVKTIIDIGTGGSCIYPLLGVKNNPDWRFTATEVDDINYKNALDIIKRNSIESIRLVKVDNEKESSLILHLFDSSTVKYVCCMCNPPFFSQFGESQIKAGPVANSSCHVGQSEAVTEGGDLAFAMKLFTESLELREKVFWYTIMLGKKSSFVALKKYIAEHKDIFFTRYEFCQGRTVRWGIGWTFCKDLVDVSKLPISPLQQKAIDNKVIKPIVFLLPKICTLEDAYHHLETLLSSINVESSLLSRSGNCILLKAIAKKATWVHVRKKSRKRKCDGDASKTFDNKEQNVDNQDSASDNNLTKPVLECEVKICIDSGSAYFEFKTGAQGQKQTLNGLVVYLKRLLTLAL